MSQSTIKKIFLHLTNFINLCLVNELQNYKKLKLFLYLIEKYLHAVLGKNIYIQKEIDCSSNSDFKYFISKIFHENKKETVLKRFFFFEMSYAAST